MNIEKDPTIFVLNDILNYIANRKMAAIKYGNTDAVDAYEGAFRFVMDIYSENVAKWQRKHPISKIIMNIKHKRRLKRFRELTNEIRGTWV